MLFSKLAILNNFYPGCCAELERKAFAYWGVLANSDGTPHISKLAPHVQDIRLDRIKIFPQEDGTVLIRYVCHLVDLVMLEGSDV